MLSCLYDGVRPPNVVERAEELGGELGSVVVVAVGYNDYENIYGANIETALGIFRSRGRARRVGDPSRGALELGAHDQRHRAGGGPASRDERRRLERVRRLAPLVAAA